MQARLTRLALCVACLAMPAWAGQQLGASAPAPAPKAEAEHRVASKNAEVQRLQHDVASQEAQSEQADRKMEQQDRAIAELRQQLEALKSAKAAPGPGH
jgi:septal ring factor EnvC (AmiA/AmiB activator)